LIGFESPRISKLMMLLDEDGMNEVAHMRLGREYYGAGRWMEATAAFRRAIEINPDNFLAWQYMGEAYERAGVTKEAESAYRHCERVATYMNDARASEYARACLSRLASVV
jgi:uncharacterized protein HemY